MKKQLSKKGSSRREFVKKTAYIAPAILTLQAAPSFARAGSDQSELRDSQKPNPNSGSPGAPGWGDSSSNPK
jgi:hypothetical protein